MTAWAMSFYRNSIEIRYRGVIICALGAIASYWFSEHFGIPAMVMAILLGLALNFLIDDQTISPGVDWSAKDFLKFGVALLGLRIAFGDIIAGGIMGPIIVVIAMLTTFLSAELLSRTLGLSKAFGRLSAGSVSICGVSAAIAVSAVLPKRKGADEELAVVITSVTALSTIAMILYPIFASYVGFDETAAGVFIGGSIHDVAQVVGAGYSMSDETGDTATFTKLMRVALLLPVVIIIGTLSRGEAVAEGTKPPLLPPFLIGFILLAGVNSLGIVPSVVSEFGTQISKAILVMSIFAVGVKSRIREIIKVGPKPFLLIFSETAIIGTMVAAGILASKQF